MACASISPSRVASLRGKLEREERVTEPEEREKSLREEHVFQEKRGVARWGSFAPAP